MFVSQAVSKENVGRFLTIQENHTFFELMTCELSRSQRKSLAMLRIEFLYLESSDVGFF